MAKKTAKKKPEPELPKDHLLDPKRIHELLGLVGPYDPPEPPIPTKGYQTFWDPGCSIDRIRERHRDLFYPTEFIERARFAKDSDSWKWRLIRLSPIEPDKVFVEQQDKLSKLGTGDEIASARELVVFLALHFLTTGKRLEIERLRCKDVLPSGRRVIVGPFSPYGLDVGSVADHWRSPGISLSAIFTPKRK